VEHRPVNELAHPLEVGLVFWFRNIKGDGVQ
jgi:hypothetical protein